MKQADYITWHLLMVDPYFHTTLMILACFFDCYDIETKTPNKENQNNID